MKNRFKNRHKENRQEYFYCGWIVIVSLMLLLKIIISPIAFANDRA